MYMNLGFNTKLPKFKLPSTRGILPRKRDVERSISSRRVREPISAKIKTAVRKRAKNTCEWKACKEKNYLDFHHKNMKNDDNRVQNIILLCPTHHRAWHDKYKRISHKDITGGETESIIVKKGDYRKAKQQMREKHSLIPKFDLPKFDY